MHLFRGLLRRILSKLSRKHKNVLWSCKCPKCCSIEQVKGQLRLDCARIHAKQQYYCFWHSLNPQPCLRSQDQKSQDRSICRIAIFCQQFRLDLYEVARSDSELENRHLCVDTIQRGTRNQDGVRQCQKQPEHQRFFLPLVICYRHRKQVLNTCRRMNLCLGCQHTRGPCLASESFFQRDEHIRE